MPVNIIRTIFAKPMVNLIKRLLITLWAINDSLAHCKNYKVTLSTIMSVACFFLSTFETM